jgi:NTP pyrophosphatase (non-canonical NTP hydrolase)
MNFTQLNDAIIAWGSERGIIQAKDAKSQLIKTMEELGELAGATAKENHDDMVDAVGDVVVTLILYCAIQEIDLTTCLNQAYREIANRKGKMVDGVFVKEE